MKIAVQYVSDGKGNPKAVQLPIAEWQKVLAKLRKYETALKVKSDLTQAFAEVTTLRKSKSKKETLTDFLDGL